MTEDKATRYHRLRRRASVLGTAAGALLLVLLVVSGASAALRDLAAAWAGGSFSGTVILYVALAALLAETLELPFAFYLGVTLERRYGLSTETTARWWADHGKGLALGLLFLVGGALLAAWLIRWRPADWWLAAAAAFTLLTVVLTQLAPVLLLPIFYDFKPLERAELRDRLVALAERAGARVMGVFEWRLGDRTRKANAALIGIGRTRRIIVSDTLLAQHSDDEIEVVLAHELAHHVHGDIWRAMAVEAVLVAVGLWLADALLTVSAGRFGLTGKADPAALPLLALGAGAASLVLRPFAHAMSRAHERRADRYALEMTHNAAAFTSAMRRLGAANLAEERPSRLAQWLFYSHPPLAARIDYARTWSSRNR